jgi:NAD(P)H dehydrogenase (quinone)
MSISFAPKSRLAVIYAGAGPTSYGLAADIAAKAWDTGADVRVRRIGEMLSPEDSANTPEWLEVLDCASDIPEADAEDFEWADIALIVSGA